MTAWTSRSIDTAVGVTVANECGPRAPTRLALDPAAAEEALELSIQVGTSRAADQFGVNRATLSYAWKRFGLGRPTDRPDGARLAR
jgi:hypothetical protein